MIVITNTIERGGAAAYSRRIISFLPLDTIIYHSSNDLSIKEHLRILLGRQKVLCIGLEARLVFSVWLRLFLGLKTYYIANGSVGFEMSQRIKHSRVALIFEMLLSHRSTMFCVSKNCQSLFPGIKTEVLPSFYFKDLKVNQELIIENWGKNRSGFLYLGGTSQIKGWNWINSVAARFEEAIIAPGVPEELKNDKLVAVPYMSPEELEDMYKSVKALIVPSVNDTFGMVVLEALLCGCPVICTNTVGAVDYLPALKEIAVEYGETESLLRELNRLESYPMFEVLKEIKKNVREVDVSFSLK